MCGGAFADDAPARSSDIEDNGVKVHWTYRPMRKTGADGLGAIEVAIADARTGAPLIYDRGQLAAWLQQRRGALSDAEPTCAEKITTFRAQKLGHRADIDLNTYRFVTLNRDGALLFINPFVGLNNAKLESVLELGGKPMNWATSLNRMEAAILIEPAKLVLIDLRERRVVRSYDLPGDGRARDLAFDALRDAIWITLPGRNALARIDLANPNEEPSFISMNAPAGLLPVANSASERRDLPGVFAASEGGDLIWADERRSAKTWKIGGQIVAARYSALAKRVITGAQDGAVSWIDPELDTAGVERRLKLPHGLRAISLFANGRLALALGYGRASVIDVATAQVRLSLRAPVDADRLVFTKTFAYAVDTQPMRATMWSLADLEAGREQPVETLLGRASSGDAERAPNLDTIVILPEGTGIVAGGGADDGLYQYAEGMMAPSGRFSNYGRTPLAVLLLDMSLREIAPGRYAAAFKHHRGGSYELAIAGLGPKFAACSRLALPQTSEEEARREPSMRASLVSVGRDAGAPDRCAIRVRLEQDGADGSSSAIAGVRDLTLLVFDRSTGWQVRAPLREAQSGEYEAQVNVPRSGRYELHASSRSRNLSFVEGHVGQTMLGATQ